MPERVGDVLERAVAPVVEQPVAARSAPAVGGNAPPCTAVDVEPAVAVEVEQAHAAAHRLGRLPLLRRPVVEPEPQAARFRVVVEPKRRSRIRLRRGDRMGTCHDGRPSEVGPQRRKLGLGRDRRVRPPSNWARPRSASASSGSRSSTNFQQMRASTGRPSDSASRASSRPRSWAPVTNSRVSNRHRARSSSALLARSRADSAVSPARISNSARRSRAWGSSGRIASKARALHARRPGRSPRRPTKRAAEPTRRVRGRRRRYGRPRCGPRACRGWRWPGRCEHGRPRGRRAASARSLRAISRRSQGRRFATPGSPCRARRGRLRARPRPRDPALARLGRLVRVGRIELGQLRDHVDSVGIVLPPVDDEPPRLTESAFDLEQAHQRLERLDGVRAAFVDGAEEIGFGDGQAVYGEFPARTEGPPRGPRRASRAAPNPRPPRPPLGDLASTRKAQAETTPRRRPGATSAGGTAPPERPHNRAGTSFETPPHAWFEPTIAQGRRDRRRPRA